MTYKIIDTTTGTITNCSLLSMSRKLEPNTILAEYNARGVLLTSYPISSVDIRRISVYFDPNAAYFSYAVERAVRAVARAAETDPAVVAYKRAEDAANAAARAANAAAAAKSTAYAVYRADYAANAATAATCAARHAAYAAYAAAHAANVAADAAWRDARAARSAYTDRLISKSKAAEYKRQGQFIMEYLRGGSI